MRRFPVTHIHGGENSQGFDNNYKYTEEKHQSGDRDKTLNQIISERSRMAHICLEVNKYLFHWIQISPSIYSSVFIHILVCSYLSKRVRSKPPLNLRFIENI